MVEFLQSFTLFGSFIGFWFCVAALIFCFFWADNEEQGYGALASFIVFLLLTHFWSNYQFIDYINYKQVLLYLIIGFIYSFIKTFFYARKHGEVGKKYLKDNVFRWWLLWPVSLTNWILSDLLKDIYSLIYKKLSGVYEKVFELGLKK